MDTATPENALVVHVRQLPLMVPVEMELCVQTRTLESKSY
jgi:hypothetical protein